MFSSRTTLAIITMLVMSSINAGHSMYSESSSETETPYITSDEAYKCLSNPFSIPRTNWNYQIEVDIVKCQLKKELMDYWYCFANREFTSIEDKKVDALVNSFCSFGKLYAKYAYRNAINLSEEEYCLVFSIMQNYENTEDKCFYSGYDFSRIGVHWQFVIKKASTDEMVLQNSTVFKTYVAMFQSEQDYYNQSKKRSTGICYRWNLCHSACYADWTRALCYEYGKLLKEIQTQLAVMTKE